VASPIDDKTAAMPKAAQPTNARPGEFMFELAGKIQTIVKAGEGEVRIQLRPEHLGNIEIKAENGIGGIVARIAAESANVKQFLETHLHSLQQSLQEQGLKVERIDIVVQEGLDLRQAGTHQQQSGQAGNGQQDAHSHAGGGNARSASSLSADELLVDSVTAAILGPNSTFHTIA
jgi:flagellar hook-length control protein FliK